MLDENNVLLMTIDPQLLGSSIDIDQVKGMVITDGDIMSMDKDLTLDNLKEQAYDLGANAVVDIHVKTSEHDEMVIYGTAVKLTLKELGKEVKHAKD